jgi:ribokinase
MSNSSVKPLCLVRSSINIDQMFSVQHVVKPGETISSSSMQSRPGGKGANVSAAVALAGQDVVMSGAVGRDAAWPIDELHSRGVKTDAIRMLDDIPTGRAFIQVAEDGENSIVLLKGANYHPDPRHADNAEVVFSSLGQSPTHLIVQNEIPLDTTKHFLRHAHQQSSPPCMTIFNPSPMLDEQQVRSFEWSHVDVLVINEGEGQDLLQAFGEKSNDGDVLDSLDQLTALQSASWLVMTKGARGVSAYVKLDQQRRQRIDVQAAKPKRVVDTTGAGDTFAGNLVAGLMRAHTSSPTSSSHSLTLDAARQIVRWAAAAAALAVERSGAMESIPRYADVDKRKHDLFA